MSHECFADEIAIDFPSAGRVAERMRDRFLGERPDGPGVVSADVSLSKYEASHGLVVPVDVPLRVTCRRCGGRGETWPEPCGDCRGAGELVSMQTVRVSVPRGTVDGARIRFRLTTPDASPVRVELRVAIRPAAI